MRTNDSKTTGLSMPELMVAMTVLFVVSTSIMGMFVTGLRQTSQATQHQDLESLTRLKVSEMREVDYATLDTLAGTSRFPAPHDAYSYTIDFLALGSNSTADARVVQVTVTHPAYGSRTGRTVRSNVAIDPGAAAWEKFGCGACHSLPSAGYPDDGYLLPLGPIPVAAPGFDGMRPIPPGPSGLETYIRASIEDPTGYRAYDPSVEGTMSEFYVEGVAPEFDPTSADPFIKANSMSTAEINALATWVTTLQ